MKFVKLCILNFDKNNNAQWIIFTKIKNKVVKLCTGIFNFDYGWCGIFTISNNFKEYSQEIFEELSYRDWDMFRPSKCHKSIKSLVRHYNKKTFGFYNPFKHK